MAELADVFLSQSEENFPLNEHTFKVLVATDIHLGFGDEKLGRENDSFNTFEEILKLAVDHDVDFVLLGGDLFHSNKPKPSVLRKATELLRKYCLGKKPVSFQYVGNPDIYFSNQDEDRDVNFYNPDMNIALPVFTIHGNHDDPVGTTKTSAIDQLAAMKLVNHFGHWNNLKGFTVSPVLLTKGETKLALYGLGYMKDSLLQPLMKAGKVVFQVPETDQDAWFNLFVLHQNRVMHDVHQYLPEEFVPEFMDLVVWGHEHECQINAKLAKNHNRTFICQPGSPVATSMSQSEAVGKHVALLRINKRQFKIDPLKLETVRPFLIKDVKAVDIFKNLPTHVGSKERSRHMERYLNRMVNELIEEAKFQLTGHVMQPILPLIRIRVFRDDDKDTFNLNGFGLVFVDKVANDDIVLFKNNHVTRADGTEIKVAEIEQFMMLQDEDDLEGHVEEIVEKYFIQARDDDENNGVLEVLSEKGLTEAVKSAVHKKDYQAISEVIESQIETAINYLINKNVTEETVEDELKAFRKRKNEVPVPNKSKVSKTGLQKPKASYVNKNEDALIPSQAKQARQTASSGGAARGQARNKRQMHL